MKRVFVLAGLAILFGLGLRGCGFRGEGPGKSEAANRVIPGPGMAGYDAELEQGMELYFRQFAVINGAAYGVGQSPMAVENGNDTDKEIIVRYFGQYPAIKDFEKFCGQDGVCNGAYNALVSNPEDPLNKGIFKGVLALSGMHGGTAMAGDLTRYAVLRDQGYPEELVEEARLRVLNQLEVLDVANSISGVPGVQAYNLRRKDHEPLWTGGEPLPPSPPPPTTPKNDHIWREDNTADQRYFDEWAWSDNVSKDQVDGWIFAMGVAWDVIADDPAIPEHYKDMLQTHARDMAHRLMEVAPEYGTDMVLRDVDGELTKNCDVNPRLLVLDVCQSAGVSPEPINTFNAVMGLGFIRVCLHIAGDEDIRDYYYNELIGNRRWHEFIRDGAFPIADMGYGTNYSNVNMAFIAFYNAIRYETDPGVRAVLQQGMEKLWDNHKNNRQPADINQTFFNVIFAGLRAGGNAPGVTAAGVRTLKEWPYPPVFWSEPVINCDADELLEGWCLAVDNETIIELPNLKNPSLYQYFATASLCDNMVGLGHGGDIVSENVIPRRLRGPSNNDWRSNPFDVNRCGSPYEVQAVPDIIAAYWLGRFLKGGTGPDRNVSPVGRVPEPPSAPSSLVATAVSEAQADLAWTDADHMEDGFVIERRMAQDAAFAVVATVPANTTAYSDAGLSPLTTYIYRVSAMNDAGLSDPSNLAPATTFAAASQPPAAASNLAATALDHERIRLTWLDASTDEIGFKIMRDGGVVASTLANVTEYTDTGLADDTTYQYQVVSFNSAGDGAASNPAAAATDKLPSISAYDPLAGQLNVAIDLGHVQVQFGDPTPESEITIVVADEVGPINGTTTLDGASTLLTFVPEPPLLTMATRYTVTVTVGAAVYEYNFYTQGAGWTVDLADAVGRTFGMDIFHATVLEPPGLDQFLEAADFAAYLLVGVVDADTPARKMQFIGALGDSEGPDPSQQDMTVPTLVFPRPADLGNNPEYVLGPFDLPISIEGINLEIKSVTLTGIFSENYEYTGKGEFEGDLDMAVIADMLGLAPADLCAMLGGCAACPGEPGRLECLHIHIINIRADELPDPIVPIAAVAQKDLGGTATRHTIELTLVHPITGLAEQGIDLRLEIKEGDGLVNGDSVAHVTTGADGKAAVTLEDPSGGADELEAYIESAVPYTWVKSWMQATF
ncbi:MAG TPA: fibronectin type III domain-containing protein [bacterium]|nr:fibronectin type III domain-containing protein [bacterium]